MTKDSLAGLPQTHYVYLMDREQLQRATTEAVRSAEIRAVAEVLRAGGKPNLGQTIDYRIDTPPGVPSKRTRPYRLEIEQWHLDAAHELVTTRGGS